MHTDAHPLSTLRPPPDGPTVLGVGETMILVAPEPFGGLREARTARIDIAGAESNVATHLAALGVGAAWAGAVGDDALGERVIDTIAQRGVDVAHARVLPGARTGVMFKDAAPDGTRVWYHREGSAASRMEAGWADALPLSTVPLVHLTGITRALSPGCAALVDRILDLREEAGRAVSFDVNLRRALWPDLATAARALIADARRATVVLTGLDEAHALWGCESAEDVRDLIPEPALLIVKDGARAAHGFGPRETASVPAPAVRVVEPVGAGDAFAAGLLTAVIAGATLEDCLGAGHRRAASALATVGDFR